MPPTASVFRAALAKRCGEDAPFGFWRVPAAAAGVSGADAFLCHLGRSILDAIRSVSLSAELARVQLQSVRASEGPLPRAIVNSRCDELEELIASAESGKVASLERELCAVDAALEGLRTERGAAAEAVAPLGDGELVIRYAELTSRLDAAEAQFLALPTNVIEIPLVRLQIDAPALLAGFGRVLSPQAITAADLFVVDPPDVHPGCAVRLRLALQGAKYATQSAEELGMSLAATAAVTHVDASLTGVPSQQPEISVVADVPGRCLVICFSVPRDTPVGASVSFGPVTVSGQQLAVQLGKLTIKEVSCRGLRD